MPAQPASRRSLASALLTFSVIAGSSLCFCAKGIFIKMGYRLGLDTMTVLALRNLLALPFFVVGVAWSERRAGGARLSGGDWARIAGLGFIGYYLSSLVNFLGLQHISVGLERMILYTYPSLVMIGSAVFLRKRLQPGAVIALLVAYAGLVLGFLAELRVGPQGNLLLGGALVFASALTYAVFTMGSGQMVHRLGPIRLMSWVLLASALMVLLHFIITHDGRALAALPWPAWKLGGFLAIVGTVIPSYLFGWGLQRAGATATSIIGMVGPLGTIVLAWLLLREPITPLQLGGLALTLAGGLGMSLRRSPKPTEGGAPTGIGPPAPDPRRYGRE